MATESDKADDAKVTTTMTEADPQQATVQPEPESSELSEER